MKSILFSVFCILVSMNSYAQVGFTNATSQVLGDENVYSTICIGFEDLDGDLQDDLFLLDEGKILKTFIQGAPSQAFTGVEHLQVSAFGDWSFISGDLDNDGVPEIICNGYEDGSQFLKFNGEKYVTQFKTENIYSQNSNLVDFNNDGFLDFFVCNDDGESLTFINNGTGGMVKTKVIDFQAVSEEDLAGNYGSIFTDIDNDGDLDLYIGKCKAEAIDPTDPRRVNALYINNGDGTYTEQGEAFGLDIGSQSWSVDAGDVDNDGDMDLIIANHRSVHDLMINDGEGHFDRRAMIPGGYETFAFQSFFTDFDNNGWLDIFITDPDATFILFNDEMSFTRRDIMPSSKQAFSGATGDLNSDGFPDLYLGFADSFQDPTSTKDRVMLNETNSNNYLDINLEGTVSNRDAIGAKVIIYHDGKSQIREITAGKSYGIMNSTVAHFGLGKSTQVDSIKIFWPSGIESTINDIEEVNTKMHITENECVSSRYAMNHLQLCGGNSVTAGLPPGYDNYSWSNGDTEAFTTIDEPGWYRGTFEKDGCTTMTSYFEVTEEFELTDEQLLPYTDQVACLGDVVELSTYPGTYYLWSNGEGTQTIEVTESGIYNVYMNTYCYIYQSEEVEIFFADTMQASVEHDTVLMGEVATLTGNGDVFNWYQNKNDLTPIASGEQFVTPPLAESQTYYAGLPTTGFAFDKTLMAIVPLNNVADSMYTENLAVEFEVKDELTLNYVRVRTQTSGFRRVLIKEGEDLLQILNVDLNVGINKIDLGIHLVPGMYSISTNAIVNQTNLGTVHPQLSYSTLFTQGDKQIEGYLEIIENEAYPGVTPYFFDWNIDYGFYHCEPRVPAHAVVKMPVSTTELSANSIVYPNPTTGILNIQTDMKLPYQLDVIDISGQKVQSTLTIEESFKSIEMPEVPGIYFIKLTNDQLSEVVKVYVN